jgi:glycosyltransferase involved in cell wall biosynthesis
MLVTLARHPGAAHPPAFVAMFPGRLERELRDAGAMVHMLPPARIAAPWTGARARRALWEVLERAPVDVVVSHSSWSQAILGRAVARAGVPLVSFMHGAVERPSLVDRAAVRHRPVLVLANSAYTARTAGRVFPGVPVDVVHPPCPPPPATGSQSRDSVRRALRASDDDVVIITPSRLEPWKGHHLLVEALGRLRTVAPWRWWQVGGAQVPGEQRYLERIRRRASALGIADRIACLGQRDDVPALLAAADIHCQANTGPEPFGLTFVEALAAGLPVVTTALGAAPEIVTPECGALVPPDDPGAIASALGGLIDRPQARIAAAPHARERARRLCDPDRQVALLDRCLQRVVSGPRLAIEPAPTGVIPGEATTGWSA